MRNQALIGVSLFVLGMLLAWQVSGKIVADDERSLIFGVSIFAGCLMAAMTLRNWRMGFFFFSFCRYPARAGKTLSAPFLVLPQPFLHAGRPASVQSKFTSYSVRRPRLQDLFLLYTVHVCGVCLDSRR